MVARENETTLRDQLITIVHMTTRSVSVVSALIYKQRMLGKVRATIETMDTSK
jgi:hypothetical protein